MLPFTWRLHHENALCNLYMMLSLYLFFCPLAEWQPSFVWTDTKSKYSFLGETNLNFRWNLVETVTQDIAQYCPATFLRKQAAKILVSPSSWGRSFNCPCEQVLINLISWVRSVQTAFVSWEVIHAQLPHFSEPLSSTIPLCWSFGKGIIFPRLFITVNKGRRGRSNSHSLTNDP